MTATTAAKSSSVYSGPRRDAISNNRHSRSIGANSKEHRMAERHLSAVPADDVPRLGHGCKKQNENDHVKCGMSLRLSQESDGSSANTATKPSHNRSFRGECFSTALVTSRKCLWAEEILQPNRDQRRQCI